jgi:hypothetical protein
VALPAGVLITHEELAAAAAVEHDGHGDTLFPPSGSAFGFVARFYVIGLRVTLATFPSRKNELRPLRFLFFSKTPTVQVSPDAKPRGNRTHHALAELCPGPR